MTMVVVRDIEPAEVAALSAVTVAAYKALDGVDVGTYLRTVADVADRHRHARVLVALDDGAVVGGVTYVPDAGNPYAEFTDPDAAGMRMLAVDPAAQGRGIGAALVEACIRCARADGRRLLVLHTTQAMTAAQRLYERMGFRRVVERDWWPQPHIRLLGYELPLDAAAAAGGAGGRGAHVPATGGPEGRSVGA